MEEGGEALASRVCIVLVTVPDPEVGRDLARKVVEESLAACGNVIPGLVSVYRWKGAIQEDSEALVVFKSTSYALPELERRVTELHPYEVPEFLALPVTHGHLPYLRWVLGEVDETDRSS
jgi:periplasmic divalent cation tolerance protein